MKILLLVALFLPKIYGDPPIEAFTCRQSKSTPNECLFDHQVFPDSGIFLPKSRNDQIVTKVTCKHCIMPTLTSSLCDKFPNLQILDIRVAKMHQIVEGALDGCTKLREIWLQDNWLKELPANLFQKNTLMEYIYLNSNNLTEIPKELFKGLRSLQKIDVSVNRLSRLPAEIFEGLTSVQSLEVFSNPLLSLEIEQMYVEMPKLKYTLFDDLDWSCTRAVEVYNFLSKNNIENNYIGSWSDFHSKGQYEHRQRIYKAEYTGNYYCINEEQNAREILIRETIPSILQKLTPQTQ